MTDTKEKILETALKLFAKDGYEAVSVSDIADELGITKGALYKHYKNKRDIFDSILARMEQNDANQATEHDMPETSLSESEDKYKNASIDDMVEFAKSMFRYWTQNDFASQFRKKYGVPPKSFKSAEFYAPMFLLYSVYDGAQDKNAILELLDSCMERSKQNLNKEM